jgi:hypothetical protein
LREPEHLLVASARELAKDEFTKNLPEIFCARRFNEYRTTWIRQELGMDEHKASQGERVLVIMLEKRLTGRLSELQGRQRLQGLIDCFEGEIDKFHSITFANAVGFVFTVHAKVWDGGVHHRDISDGNLMYWQDPETQQIMAIDLLKSNEGEVSHIYRHDAESFMWVMLYWATDGHRGPSIEWMQDYKTAGLAKVSFINDRSSWSNCGADAVDVTLWNTVEIILLRFSEIMFLINVQTGQLPRFSSYLKTAKDKKQNTVLHSRPLLESQICDELRALYRDVLAVGLEVYDTESVL